MSNPSPKENKIINNPSGLKKIVEPNIVAWHFTTKGHSPRRSCT